MIFAIRDDDTSYFTKPQEFEMAYDFLKDGCISISIVPFTVPVHKDSIFPYGEGIPYGYYSIEGNIELIKWLKEKKEAKRVEILMHGYSHEYKKYFGKWQAEMIWKDKRNIYKEIQSGKILLEKLFNTKVSIFIAPNNMINKKAINTLEKLDMNYSGIIQHNDRMITIRYFINYLLRWSYRLIYNIPYGGILNYGKHLELNAYGIDRIDRLKYEYKMCKIKGHPFVIYTHYWSLIKNPELKMQLIELYNYLIEDGAKLVPLSKCFKK